MRLPIKVLGAHCTIMKPKLCDENAKNNEIYISMFVLVHSLLNVSRERFCIHYVKSTNG
jgi:hypothetical protein